MKKLIFALVSLVGLSQMVAARPHEAPRYRYERVMQWWLDNLENLRPTDIRIGDSDKNWPIGKAPGNGWRPVNSKNSKLGACHARDLFFYVADPFTNAPRKIKLREYMPPNGHADLQNLKKLILLPPTGGQNRGDKGVGSYLCPYGFHLVILKTDLSEEIGTRFKDKKSNKEKFAFTEEEISAEYTDRGAVRALVDVGYALSYLRPKHNMQVGIIGSSVGGIMAALNVSLNSKINVAAIIMAGGNMPHILAHSDLDSLAELGRKRRELNPMCAEVNPLNCTNEDYEKWLESRIGIEPLVYAEASTGKKILQFLNKDDLTVPGADQRALAQAFDHSGNSHKVDYYKNRTHVGSITDVYLFQLDKLVDFFMDHLREGNNPN